MFAGCYGAVGGRYVWITNVVNDVNIDAEVEIGLSLRFVLLLALALA